MEGQVPSDAAVVGRSERARGLHQAAARGQGRRRVEGQMEYDAAVVGRLEWHEVVVKLLRSATP